MMLKTAINLLLLLLTSRNVPSIDAVTLITFDVDGTLIHGTGQAASEGAHAQAFRHAVATVLGNGEESIAPVANALPRRLYHGSTDGLILLRYARAVLDVEPHDSMPHLERLMQVMYDFIQQLDDAQVGAHLAPLPGVMNTLHHLATKYDKDQVKCGLVTGNVEGIARRKMKAVGIWDTGALHPPCPTQRQWEGTEHLGFLGAFGSDYCSGNIDDLERNHLDRGEQIAIAAKRCQNLLGHQRPLKRVVHVGDAPADVLAAKAFSETNPGVVVGMVAVATGSYSAKELKELAGEPQPGKWEPVVLERGMDDPGFLEACGIQES